MTDQNLEEKKKAKALLPNKAKKRLFVGYLSLAILFCMAMLALLWYIAEPGLAGIWQPLPAVVGAVFVLITLLSLWGIATIVFAVLGLPYLPFFKRQTYALINLLFPLAVRIGSLFGISRRQLEGSFITVSNLMFDRMQVRVPAERLLVITPHCLQLATCPHKITRDPHNCKRCGRCDNRSEHLSNRFPWFGRLHYLP